ncbi:antitoxin Xre/MbcA/ParS toxin-binding domain-containing protein [Ramlibacter albus]|uniref:DUF2384 domain-containing protein n=1 Tax=Ramlibacter albus TaxID=2079448 RepID=A0A923MDE2_9BURK|nr:antitoxin Xre/MbcA/ParS toxin-binding domain-containing protein [Ramlibacter albus]MBC5767965.1 DUF2384 domain-containing protein [Ramlibacter albus]
MDPRWFTFAQACRPEFDKCSFQGELIAACGGAEDIAWALFFHMGAQSMSWLQRSIPALDGSVPSHLIATGHGDRVRECLWRMP